MTKEAAEIITNTGYGEIYENYSGRGMYGRETTGVTFESEDEWYKALSEVMTLEDQEERETVALFLSDGVKRDSLGRNLIIY